MVVVTTALQKLQRETASVQTYLDRIEYSDDDALKPRILVASHAAT